MREIIFWLLLCKTVCGQFEYAQETQFAPSLLPQTTAMKLGDMADRLTALEMENTSLRIKFKAAVGREFLPTTITEHTLVNSEGDSVCSACNEWWNGPQPRELRGVGWIVKKLGIRQAEQGKLYPRWEIDIAEDKGFIEFTKDFRSELRQYLNNRKK